ncbi:MAG: prepilin peptidase [Planctomycetaceae bacterium]|nr:prepilin peptidase [Planctomycetaceae bacterium]
MFDLSFQSWLLVLVVGAYTTAAATWDWRHWRIPNKLTLPTFALGWVYQAVFHGWAGLGAAALGFLCGFGVLFVLWIVGGGGGGDVKLMGALSVWLGFSLTLNVLIASTLMVIFGTAAVLIWSMLTSGIRKTQDRYLATGKTQGTEPRGASTRVAERQQRRVMGYAVPVALATWLILLYQLPTLP